MTTRKLTVLKPGKYGTRHLTAGEEFEVPIREAVALVVTRKAKFTDKAAARVAEKSEFKVAAPQVVDDPTPHVHAIGALTSMSDIDALRREAAQLGIDVDGRWGVPRLRHEIELAKDR